MIIITDQIYMGYSIAVIIQFIQIFSKYHIFLVCACKHHILISVTRIKPCPSFEKPRFATKRTPKENGILYTP